MKAQSSAADRENSNAAVDASNPDSQTIAENQGGDDVNDSSAAATVVDGGGAMLAEEAGILGSIGQKLTSIWGG